MSAYTKMLPHLENGCYDYDFWNVMRGKTHNENLIRDFKYPCIHLKNKGLSIIKPGERTDDMEI